jgi:hypothetical protein
MLKMEAIDFGSKIFAFGLGGRRIFDVADQALQLSFADAIDLYDVFGFV